MNEVIREVKGLITEDPYIKRLMEFVPAGDNPQHRDVVLVLRQVRQGLQRFNDDFEARHNADSGRLAEARYIQSALELHLEGGLPKRDNLSHVYSSRYDNWLKPSLPNYFNFDRLDNINIAEYFEDKT